MSVSVREQRKCLSRRSTEKQERDKVSVPEEESTEKVSVPVTRGKVSVPVSVAKRLSLDEREGEVSVPVEGFPPGGLQSAI